jgi:amidase
VVRRADRAAGRRAAVAAGVVALAHGSDATGSLRCPAALCGIATLNPTAGRIPNVAPAGQPPSAVWRDFVLARHAVDLQLAFEVLAGSTAVADTGLLRVGLLDHDPELGMTVDPACRTAVDVAARLLADLGHDVDGSWPAPLGHLGGACFESFAVTSDATRQPVLTWLTDRLGREPADGDLAPEVFEAAARAATRSPADVAAAQATIDAAVAPIEGWWEHHDLLVTPATFRSGWALGGAPGPAEIGTLAAPFSLSGQPALSLPLHQTPEGLPVGVQIVGRRGADEVLLRLAADLQAVSDWTVRRPPTSVG